MADIVGALYKNISASAQVKAGVGKVYGVLVNSNSSGTLKLWDALTATGNVIMNTYTFPTGSSVIGFPEPINFTVGLFATIAGTGDITVLYN